MSKHVHAELMAQYAQDALETDRPWERWQVKGPEMITHVSNPRDKDGYITCECHPSWHPSHVYRRKPHRVQIAGEVFDDVLIFQPSKEEPVFVLTSTNNIKGLSSRNVARTLFKEGRVHTTYEGALRHLEALKPKVL